MAPKELQEKKLASFRKFNNVNKEDPLYQELLKLPKTDLHVHLDGSMRIETILELAEEQGVKLPANDAEGLKKIVQVSEECNSLVEYLRAFDVTLSVLQKREAITRTTYELLEDAAAENVRYMEIRYSPILHVEKGLSLTSIVEAVIEGCRTAEKDFGIKSGIIICAMRHMDSSVSLRLAELTIAFKNRGVVGFDLAGAEANFPPKHHIDAFYLTLNNNINCTLHAGEAYGAESIAQAIHYCGVHRIGHGTRLREDGDLLNYVNDCRIPLEICLVSNVQTGSVNHLEDHPLRFYFDYGLRVTMNTDNRLVSDTTITKELYLACRYLGFGVEQIKDIIVNGFKSSFLSQREKIKLLSEILPDLGRALPYN